LIEGRAGPLIFSGIPTHVFCLFSIDKFRTKFARKVDMSTSLEDAIRMARKAAYRETDDSIEIERSGKYASRKRTKDQYGAGMAVVSKGAAGIAKIGNGFFDETPNAEAAFWKAKFEEVQKLQNDAEDDLASQAKIHKEREASLEQYANLLAQKVQSLESGVRVGEVVANKTGTEASTSGNHKEKRIIDFFELVTGMTIQEQMDEQYNDGTPKYICTMKNVLERKATRFSIAPAEENPMAELDFTPLANVDVLPEFLQQDITFERAMAPAMFAAALSALYEDEDAEGDDENGGDEESNMDDAEQ
jgi:hypothetical protein